MKHCARIVLFAFAAFHLAANADTIRLAVKSNQSQFVVRLPANPTTGYQLKVQAYDHKVLKLLSHQFIAPKKNLIGAGGTMQFTFQHLNGAAKSTQINFQYVRPWEPKPTGSSKVVVIQFESL